MVQKRLIVAEHRRSPARTGFGRIDRRLVDDGFIDALDGDQTRHYLLLVIVSDRDGLSSYGDRRFARSLRWTFDELDVARRELKRPVAFRAPLDHVLSLDVRHPPGPGMPIDITRAGIVAVTTQRSHDLYAHFARVLDDEEACLGRMCFRTIRDNDSPLRSIHRGQGAD